MNSRSIPLACPCPPSCMCGSKEVKNWTHYPCSYPAMLNENGEVHSSKPNCAPIFISDYTFRCTESNTYTKFRSATSFLMALA